MRFALCVLILHVGATLHSQNLVPNGSFEDYISCPGSYSRIHSDLKVREWYSGGTGTPDAYNTCSTGDSSVPYNWAGVSEPYDGLGYAGIYLWIKGKDFREYLQCQLTHGLVQDSTYTVSFRYRLSSYSNYVIDRIALLLSDSALINKHDKRFLQMPTFNRVSDSVLHRRTGSWELFSYEYKAKGDERYITIGNFDRDDQTNFYKFIHRPVQEPMLAHAAYYYIDDVSVRSKYDSTIIKPQIPVFTHQEFVVNKDYILDNVHFSFNSYGLLPRSYEQLDEVAALMRKNPSFRAVISGHTDDVGSDSYNLTLSRKRAQTVAMYLSQKGVNSSRLEIAGFGKRMPLAEGTTDEVRRVNRRVEIRFIE